MRLHLGCGNEYIPGWLNVDKSKDSAADEFWDLEEPFPLNDNTVSSIRSKFLIEHIANDKQFFNEMYRVCRDGARVHLFVPKFPGEGAVDWDHKSFWNMRKFNYLLARNRDTEMGLECNFTIIEAIEHVDNGIEILDVLLGVVK